MTDASGFGARVRQLREAARLSQSALARKVGTSQSAISQIEDGTRGAGIALAQRIAGALGTTFALVNSEATPLDDPAVAARIAADALLRETTAERDAAVEWIGCVRDELVMAGGAGGDRVVALANLRALIRERDALRDALGAIRSYVWLGRHSGIAASLVHQIIDAADGALSARAGEG